MTHPGDFTDNSVEQNLATASGVPWEQPVREVSLSARADTVSDMATVWQAYITHLGSIADKLDRIWIKDLADTWKGEAATACQAKWNDILNKFSQVIRNYGESGATATGVPGLLRDTATAIHDAIGTIPIPIFGSSTLNDSSVAVLPNNQGVSKTGGTSWGDQLYADYQAGPHSYENYAFLEIAQSAAAQKSKGTYSHVPAGSRLRTSPNSQYDTGDPASQLTTNYQARKNQAAYDDQVQAWYTSNQRLAYTSYNTLLNTYAKHQTSVPDKILRFAIEPTPPKATPPNGTGPTGFDPTGTGATSGAFPGATHPGAALPGSGAGSLSDTAPTSSSGLSGVDGSGPIGALDPGLGAITGPGLSSGSGLGGGVGSVSGVGFSPGSGALPGEGAGVIPDPLGRVGSGPGVAADGLPATRNTGASSGLGMMGPGYGGGAGQERDESQSWLIEDQDIWGLNDNPDMVPPDGII
jgi:uncharacterized protein YukE